MAPSLFLPREVDIPDYFPHNNLVLHDEITVPSSTLSDTVYLKDIRFAFNKSAFDETYRTYLEDLVEIMMKYPGLALQVNGYADAMGSESYNMKLSLLRANSVVDYLKHKIGLSERISVRPMVRRIR